MFTNLGIGFWEILSNQGIKSWVVSLEFLTCVHPIVLGVRIRSLSIDIKPVLHAFSPIFLEDCTCVGILPLSFCSCFGPVLWVQNYMILAEKRAFLTENCKKFKFIVIFSLKSLVVSKKRRTFAPA